MSTRRLIRRSPAVSLALDRGWTIEGSSERHYALLCPHGCCRVVVAGSSSDWRADRNTAARIRRCPNYQEDQ